MRSRYKRIVFNGIWNASLTFQYMQATFIKIELNQLSLVIENALYYQQVS